MIEQRILTPEIAREVLLGESIDEARIDGFLERHRKYPWIWKSFERLALEAATEGRRVGQNCIRELVRWEYSKEHPTAASEHRGYLVNNNDTPLHTILFAWKHPQHAGFFEQRECRKRVA